MVALGAVGLVAGGAVMVTSMSLASLEVSGVDEGAVLRPADIRALQLRIDAGGVAAGPVRASITVHDASPCTVMGTAARDRRR